MTTHTWDTLVESLRLREPSVAHSVLAGSEAPDWDAQPDEFQALPPPGNEASSKALSLRLALMEDRKYFLAVVGENVLGFYEACEPMEMSVTGGIFMAFGHRERLG